jgi:lysophospholipase L1-like esterase
LISNSQGSPVGIHYNQSYPFLLQGMMPDTVFHYWIMSGGNVRDLNNQIENLLIVRPDLVVLQIGIVECTQRILSSKEKEIFSVLPFGRFITRKLHENRSRVIKIRKTLHCASRQTSPQKFKQEIQTLAQRLQAENIHSVFLEIPRLYPEFGVQHFPYINDDIDLYNNILRDFGAVPFFLESENYSSFWQPNSVHFTAKGHQQIAENLEQLLLQKLYQLSNSTTTNVEKHL